MAGAAGFPPKADRLLYPAHKTIQKTGTNVPALWMAGRCNPG